jgi:type I restriction enzyme R subunit
MTRPEAEARERIDASLAAAGWAVQDPDAVNLTAARGVAIREFPLVRGHGHADYLLYVDRKAAGVIEAKKEGTTLTGVEVQAAKYSEGVPPTVPAHFRPLPFLYQSTGIETRFTNAFDPQPRSRRVFQFHRPDTLAGWLGPLSSGDEPLRNDRAADAPPVAGVARSRLILTFVRYTFT